MVLYYAWYYKGEILELTARFSFAAQEISNNWVSEKKNWDLFEKVLQKLSFSKIVLVYK